MKYPNPFDEILTGLQIKDWIWYHSSHRTKYTSLAKRMHSFFNLDDQKKYRMTLQDNVPIAEEEGGL